VKQNKYSLVSGNQVWFKFQNSTLHHSRLVTESANWITNSKCWTNNKHKVVKLLFIFSLLLIFLLLACTRYIYNWIQSSDRNMKVDTHYTLMCFSCIYMLFYLKTTFTSLEVQNECKTCLEKREEKIHY
jgi:hypothetical protein